MRLQWAQRIQHHQHPTTHRASRRGCAQKVSPQEKSGDLRKKWRLTMRIAKLAPAQSRNNTAVSFEHRCGRINRLDCPISHSPLAATRPPRIPYADDPPITTSREPRWLLSFKNNSHSEMWGKGVCDIWEKWVVWVEKLAALLCTRLLSGLLSGARGCALGAGGGVCGRRQRHESRAHATASPSDRCSHSRDEHRLEHRLLCTRRRGSLCAPRRRRGCERVRDDRRGCVQWRPFLPTWPSSAKQGSLRAPATAGCAAWRARARAASCPPA